MAGDIGFKLTTIHLIIRVEFCQLNELPVESSFNIYIHHTNNILK